MINCLLIFPAEMPYFLDFPGGTIDKNLPEMQRTHVRSLVWEDSTCPGATKPMGRN